MQIEMDTIIQRRNDVLTSHIQEEAILLSLNSNNYFALNGPASRIWQLLEKKVTINYILNQLITEYNITAEKCSNDVIPFIDKLNSNKLIYISE